MGPFIDLDLLLERYTTENDDLGAFENKVLYDSFVAYLKPTDQVDRNALPRLSSEVSDGYIRVQFRKTRKGGCGSLFANIFLPQEELHRFYRAM